MPIRLPQKPTGDDYEDLVAAYLIALGYFIESKLHLRKASVEVAELDIIATPVKNPLTEAVLLDAKSGKSGFADIFKLYGWMTYLGVGKGCVMRTSPPEKYQVAAMTEVTKDTNVHVATLDITSSTVDVKCLDDRSLAIPDKVRDAMLSAGWWGRIAQRKCLRSFLDFRRKTGSGTAQLDAAVGYRWAIEQAFLARRPIKRAKLLYAAYKASPNISGGMVELFAEKDGEDTNTVWNKVRDTHHYKEVQCTLMMENSARLGILKNALLHILEKEANEAPKKTSAFDWSAFEEWSMPETFLSGLKKLKDHPHRLKIPRLFQVFIEIFGGFYRVDDDADLQHLSAATAIPVDEVVPCLEMFNDFFPISNGWFTSPANGELRMMKMIPAVFRGTGAFLRWYLHGNPKDYDGIYPKMGWLVREWHNAIYKVLEPVLKATPTPA